MKSPEQNEITEDPIQRVWQEQINGMCFYHGASELFLSSIQEQGFPYQNPIYAQPAVQQASQLMTELWNYDPDSMKKFGKTYVSTSPYCAYDYAKAGPEMLREVNYFLDEILSPENEYAIQKLNERAIDQNEFLLPAKAILGDFFAMHTPALIMIKPSSLSMNDFIRNTLPEVHGWRQDQTSFHNSAMELVTTMRDPESAAWLLLERYGDDLDDLPLNISIPPEDLIIYPNRFIHLIISDELSIL